MVDNDLQALRDFNAQFGANGGEQEPVDDLSALKAFNENIAKQDRIDSPLRTAAESFASTATFGLSDVALTKGFGVSGEEIKARQEANPIANVAGSLGGLFVPTGAAGVIGKVGKLTELAIASRFANSASKLAANKILSSVAAKAAGSAVEGTFWGAKQVVSEAALGDPKEAAENALSTIGLSALLSGTTTSALSLAGKGLKAAAVGAAPTVKNIFSKVRGIDDDTINVLSRAPEKLDEIEALGTNPQESIFGYASQKASNYQEARSSFIKRITDERGKVLDEVGKAGAPVPIDDYISIIDKAKAKISPDDLAATPQIQKYIDDLQDAKDRLVNIGKRNAGFESVPNEALDQSTLFISAKQLNALKQQYDDSAEFVSEIGKTTPLEKMYADLGNLSRRKLDALDPRITKLNRQLHEGIEAQQALKLYGLNKSDVDPAKLQKLLTANKDVLAKTKEHVQKLDDLYGTDLLESQKLGKAFKQLNPGDAFSSSFTGKSLLLPALGGALGAPFGGVGAGLGTLAAGLLQSPAATPALVKAGTRVADALKGSTDGISRLGGNLNRVIPPGLIPYVSAQVAALSQLERQNNSVNNKINQTASSIFKEDEDFDSEPASLSALQKTNFGKGRVMSEEDRQRAFEKRTEELISIVTDPQRLSGLLDANLKEVSLIAPNVAQNLTDQGVRAAQFLHSKIPKNPYVNLPLSKQKWQPSDADLAKFERYTQAVDNPLSVLDDIKAKRLAPESVETMRALFPALYSKLAGKTLEKLNSVKRPLSYVEKMQLSLLLGQPLDFSQTNVAMLQSNFQNDMTQEAPAKQNSVSPSRADKLQFNKSRATQTDRITSR